MCDYFTEFLLAVSVSSVLFLSITLSMKSDTFISFKCHDSAMLLKISMERIGSSYFEFIIGRY